LVETQAEFLVETFGAVVGQVGLFYQL